MAAQPSDPPTDLRSLARALRLDGLTRAEIARDLGISTWRVTELLAGVPPRSPNLRTQAKDDLHDRARELRLEGRTMPEIAAELGVSKSSVSLWTRDLPKPPPRKPDTYEYERIAAARRARWDEYLQDREDERQAVKSLAASDVGELSDRELLLLGVALYWAEGSKDKPYDRRERLVLINSDPDVIRVYLQWLPLLGIEREQLTFNLSIHESADLEAATAFWLGVVGEGGSWRKPSLKRHNPRSVRKNVGNHYHGCLVVYAKQSRLHYQRMDGFWRGIVDAAVRRGVIGSPAPFEGVPGPGSSPGGGTESGTHETSPPHPASRVGPAPGESTPAAEQTPTDDRERASRPPRGDRP